MHPLLILLLLLAALILLPESGTPDTSLTSREQAFIAYNQGIACERRNPNLCAAYFQHAYRLLPTHPLIAAKARRLGLHLAHSPVPKKSGAI